MKRINVRCCCTPTKILGTLPARGGPEATFLRQDGGPPVRLTVRTYSDQIMVSDAVLADMRPEVQEAMQALVRSSREKAYYSEETPLEVLRQIRAFIEGDQVPTTHNQESVTQE